MKDIRTPGDPGQNPESYSTLHSRPAAANEPPRAEIASKLIASIRTATELAKRLVVARDDAPGDMGPPLAMCSDGTLLVNAEFLPGAILEGRMLWIGVPVERERLKEVQAVFEEAALEAVGRITAEEGEGEEPAEQRPPTGARIDENPADANP